MMISLLTFLSLDCLALSSFAVVAPDEALALALAAGFLTISISCCNDSGDPGFAASCKVHKVKSHKEISINCILSNEITNTTFANASTRLWSSEMTTLDSSVTKV